MHEDGQGYQVLLCFWDTSEGFKSSHLIFFLRTAIVSVVEQFSS